MSEVSNTLPAGAMLQEYRIDSVLGAGGFGITYKAWDTHLNTWVAIKEYFPAEWCYRSHGGVSVLSNTVASKAAEEGQGFDYDWGLSRFLDEARVLARVQSPHVVRIRRYFRANGSAYIVMDYEEGEPLNRLLRRVKTLTEADVLGLLKEVLPALQSVHDQGFLHRDIKPSNLYVRARDGCVMLIDFGAAREAIGRVSRSITGLVTPGYSPPEQYAIRSDRYGPWTDMYALGAVLYRCISGKPPLEAAERLLEDRLLLAREIGAGHYGMPLLAAIDKALAIRPEARYQSALEMQQDLGMLAPPARADVADDVATVPAPGGPGDERTRVAAGAIVRPRGRWPWWLGLPVTLAVAASVWLLGGEEAPVPADVAPETPAQAEQSAEPAPVVEPADDAPVERDGGQGEAASPGEVPEDATPAASMVAAEPAEDYLEAHIDMPMAWVPGGCFTMGSPSEEVGREDNETPHQRCVEGFWLSRHEVSNAQFRQFREDHDSGAYKRQSFDGERQPVVEVNWFDAVAFTRWLSQQTGRRYRLPSEVEWEYAARAGTRTARFWGDAPASACVYANIHDQQSREVNPELEETFWQDFHDCNDGAAITTAVGSYRPNAWGLYDVLGNVWEWTCSAYRENPTEVKGECAGEDQGARTLRGGAWFTTPDSVRTARRFPFGPAEVLDGIGFRLLRETTPTE